MRVFVEMLWLAFFLGVLLDLLHDLILLMPDSH